MNSTPFKKRSDPFVGSMPSAEKPVQEKVVEAPKPVVVKKVEDDASREKYTATMNKDLRKRIKVAAAMTGVQVSTFIEQACLEKLEREGQ